MKVNRILLSRTDSIGDVIVSLPLAGVLKKQFPEVWIGFIGKSYTKDVISCAKNVDEFINYDDLVNNKDRDAIEMVKNYKADVVVFVLPNYKMAKWCKSAGIAKRIGVNRRLPHWWLLNTMVSFSRKNSDLHESQLNVKLLEPIIGKQEFSTKELDELNPFTAKEKPNDLVSEWTAKLGKKVCLHPKSQGSAIEWGVPNFSKLANLLADKGITVFITGTETEGKLIRSDFDFNNSNIIDTSGKLSLGQLITFISKCDSLVAASTGPLHIASALGIQSVGLFTPKRPMHPGRWAPIGVNAVSVVDDENCSTCKDSSEVCNCVQNISPDIISSIILD